MRTQLTLQAAHLSLGDNGPFAGYVAVPQQTWNGWAVPLFPLEVCEKILKTLEKETNATLSHSIEEEVILLADSTYPQEPERVEPALYLTQSGPQLLYCLGGYSWCWRITAPQN